MDPWITGMPYKTLWKHIGVYHSLSTLTGGVPWVGGYPAPPGIIIKIKIKIKKKNNHHQNL